MPAVTPLAQIKEMEDDQLVYIARGTISGIYDRKEGTNEHGEWSFQGVELTEGTTKVKVKLKDRPAMAKSCKGKVVEFSSFHGDKGWSGVKVKSDEYPKGTFTNILYVTGSAEMAFIGDNGHAAPAEKQAKPAQMPSQREVTQGPGQSQSDSAPREHPLTGARNFLMQWANAYLLSFDAANYVAEQIELRTGRVLDVSMIKDIATSASIAFAKEMNIQGMPHKPMPLPKKGDTAALKPSQQEAPPEPKPKPEPKPDKKKPDPDPDDDADDIPF